MKNSKGFFAIVALVFAGIAVSIITVLISFAGSNIQAGRRALASEQALQLAEAGNEYYRWHLAHDQADFSDGGGPFPHIRNFYDRNGSLVGTYELTIIPPMTGSTLVTIRAKGIPLADTSSVRTVESKLAKPSFAKFALVSNSNMRFGQGTDVVGPVHSNGGIRFDGLAHNIVTSSVANYNDPDHSGNNEFGVHSHVNPPPGTGINDTFRSNEAPPTDPVPVRTDVFLAGRRFPVPIVNFTGITSDLVDLKAQAESNGKYFASSTAEGYKLVFKINDTYDIFRVNTTQPPPGGCTNAAGQSGWGSWSVGSTTFVGNFANPVNGIIFVEDNVWVEGQIDSARVTLAAGKLPEGVDQKSITVNNDLLYTNYDGRDVISLIAQNNFNVGLFSLDSMRIDAALISKNGRIGRYYYGGGCSPYHARSTLTLYGMIGSAQRYGFAYVDGTGYMTRNLVYDANLLYAPPPSFPLTTNTYQIVSWQELANN